MRRMSPIALALAAAILLGACGSMPEDAGGQGATTAASSAGGTAAASAGGSSPIVAGKPVVTVEGNVVRVEGLANATSGKFPLNGAMLMTVTKCASNGAVPFIWLYTSTNQGAGQYVDEQTSLKNLKGEYYIQVASNPDCAWKVTFTPQ